MSEFICSQKDLKKALELAYKAIPSRPTHLVLGNFLIDVTKTKVKVTAFDLSKYVSVSDIPSESHKPGSYTVPARLLIDLIKSLSGELRLTTDEKELKITSSTGVYKILIANADDYPAHPELFGLTTLSLSPQVLLNGFKAVIYAGSKDETKQVLTGVNVCFDEQNLLLAATDGHRLAALQIPDLPTFETIETTIPITALPLIMTGLETCLDDTVEMSISDRDIKFVISGNEFISRTLEGQYPKYKQLIPSEFAGKIITDRKSLIEAVERAKLVSVKSTFTIESDTGNQVLIISGATTEVGSSVESLPAQTDIDLKFAANTTYLLDCLKSIKSEEIVLNLNTQTAPVIIYGIGESNCKHLIMPVQIRD